MKNPEIRFVKNKNIDRTKWDQCIKSSAGPQIYASSCYLDLISPNWDGLVCEDYRFVMPLIVRQKLKMFFLLQPIFGQQHGIFPDAPHEIQTTFLTYIQGHYSYISIHLNTSHTPPFPKQFEVTECQNLLLQLNADYSIIRSHYSKHTCRQIKKTISQNISVVKGILPDEYIRLKNLATAQKLQKKSMRTLRQLIEYGYKTGTGTIYGAYDETNILCAAAFFLNDGQRVTYLNAASTAEGKQNSSMYQIVDTFIREHAGLPLTLDFEGSSIPGIARFYKGFGAKEEIYYALKMNRLPIPFRWIKK